MMAGCPPWVCIYLRLVGCERQHHPKQMSLEIHFGRTRNKTCSRHFLLSCRHLYLTLSASFFLHPSSFSCFGKWERSLPKICFFPFTAYVRVWMTVAAFVIANTFEMGREKVQEGKERGISCLSNWWDELRGTLNTSQFRVRVFTHRKCEILVCVYFTSKL